MSAPNEVWAYSDGRGSEAHTSIHRPIRYLRAGLKCGACAKWLDMSCESPGNGECLEYEYDYRCDHPACMDFSEKKR